MLQIERLSERITWIEFVVCGSRSDSMKHYEVLQEIYENVPFDDVLRTREAMG